MKIIHIRLTPTASANRIGEVRKVNNVEQLMVYVTEPPEDGKANKAMIELLAKHFKVSLSSIKILKGHFDRNKIINIV